MKVDFRPGHAFPLSAPRPQYGPAKRVASRWRWYGILTLLSLPFLYLANTIAHALLDISAPGYISMKTMELRASTPGMVTNLYVRTGDEVRAGERLAEVSDPKIEARAQALREEIAGMRTLQAGTVQITSPTGDTSAHAEVVKSAFDSLQSQRLMLTQINNLLKRGAATNADLRDAQERVDAAQSAYLRARLDSVEATKKEVQAPPTLQGDILSISAELNTLQHTIDLGVSKAPFSGRITALYVAAGEYISSDHPMLLIERKQAPHIMAYIDPSHADAATIGAKAWVELPGHKQVSASVTDISPIAKPLPTILLSPLSVQHDTIELTLKPDLPLGSDQRINGLPVHVSFQRLEPPALKVIGTFPTKLTQFIRSLT